VPQRARRHLIDAGGATRTARIPGRVEHEVLEHLGFADDADA
jgi:hypothetical protein